MNNVHVINCSSYHSKNWKTSASAKTNSNSWSRNTRTDPRRNLAGICRQVVEQCSESDSGNVLNALTASLNRLSMSTFGSVRWVKPGSLLTSAHIQVEEAVGELNRFLDNFDADRLACNTWKSASTLSIPWHANTGFHRTEVGECSRSCWMKSKP